MFGPKDRAALSSIVERHARLLAAAGEELGARPLVLPTAEFFPDRFTGDEASARRLVSRMLEHAGLVDVPVTTRVVEEDEPESPHGGGCSTGCAVPVANAASAPRLVDDGDGFLLNVPAPELAHPVVLTTMIARALGHVLLVETSPSGAVIEGPVDLVADYAAVALGFGPLMLAGAYIYSSGCGGPRVARVTRAALPELAVLTALFMEMGGHGARKIMKELGATQADALSHALEWARSNRELCDRLKRDPERVAAGDYSLRDAKPWLVRLFERKAKPADDDIPADLLAPRAAAPKPRDAASEELANLVHEALEAARTDAE
ncbi:MAG TPA: hypothetical protein VHC69_04125 [Polyangiaceae bacterium]|nr:hypothetical protein [Polyangiaceae bacterium]